MDSATNNIVICENISKKVGDFCLRDISFQLPKGYLLGVIGRNGCGKTTLLKCLMGMYRLQTPGANGDVYINGVGINQDEKKFKKQYAYVSHENPFLDSYKVKELGEAFGCYYDGFTMKRYLDNLQRFEIPTKETIANLSKGQQIKVQLAFAMSIDAQVYIFDEPTGNLDVEFRQEFYSMIRSLMEEGEKSVIYASHLVEELESIADYLLWIQKEDNEGKVEFFGTVDDCLEQYRMLEGAGLPTGLSEEYIVGGRNRENSSQWLVLSQGLSAEQKSQARYADLKEIMYYVEKGESN